MSTSLSPFPGPSSARPLKRRLSPSADLAFFTPAADSFNPKPYAPNSTSPSPHVQDPSKHPLVRNLAPLAHHIPLMDPSLSDPDVVFIHPPFAAFPSANLYPEGLSYSLMAANPEWFLDPNDFISSISTNPDAIPYPPQLEPPRGWCPAKKKDLKALGPDGWPEGEEPRLRCTFCRRTYAGVNAKSMWRRHVYEKHKIAMSNRRDANDRNRSGRGSNKDQHRSTVSDKENLSEDLRRVSKTSTDQPSNNIKSKPRSFLIPSDSTVKNRDQGQGEGVTSSPTPLVERPGSPQLVPLPTSNPSINAVKAGVHQAVSSGNPTSDQMTSSPPTVPITLPMSPYDPTLTPSFRHSPPRLPSDQPWRFPSPSHPLHSKARELCLGMLVRGGISPAIKVSANDSSSPSLGTPSVIHTPSSAAGRSKPFNDAFGSSPVIFRASPRQLFPDGQSPFPSFSALDLRKRVNDSPLSSSIKRRMHYRKPSMMNTSFDLHPDWLSDVSLSSASAIGAESPSRSSNEDPFGGLYKPLLESRTREDGTDQRTPSPCGSSSETESPVVRNARHSAPELEAGLVGLGIGLMAPFRLSTCRTQPNHVTEGSPMENDEEEVERVLTDGSPGSPTEILSSRHPRSPPLKKRRTSIEAVDAEIQVL